MDDKYFLIEHTEDAEGYFPSNIAGEFDTMPKALEAFNKHLKGNYLGAPNFGRNPNAYIIKGQKFPITIKKEGVIYYE